MPLRFVPRRVKTAVRALLVDTPLLPAPARADENRQGAPPASPCPAETILLADRCPVCGDAERTPVSEFNRFILLSDPPDEAAARYDYELCHACGVVFAARRPSGPRYRWLLRHFEETLGRDADRAPGVRKVTLSAFDLTDAERETLRTLARRGVFVSEYPDVSRKEYLPALFADRFANAGHVEVLGSLLELRQPRVLEIRSRLGSISSALRRLYDADVRAMTLFENQRVVIEEAYGIPVVGAIDYDSFSIPADGIFDLIVANHMLTHVVRPGAFLRTLHDRLAPGGHLYVFNEPDDSEFLLEGKSMFNTLNAFHLQAFDRASLGRALEANGFTVRFLARQDGNLLCLAQRREDSDWTRLESRGRDRRRTAYLRARDAAMLMMPPAVRPRVADLWEDMLTRAFASGLAEVGADGRPRLRRQRGSSAEHDA